MVAVVNICFGIYYFIRGGHHTSVFVFTYNYTWDIRTPTDDSNVVQDFDVPAVTSGILGILSTCVPLPSI